VKLTPNFLLAEFTRSETAARLQLSNEPNAEHLANLRVAALGMEMVRLILGKPIRVTSGYRAPAVNRAVGGTATSAHALGFAVDFIVGNLGLAAAARALVGRLPYDQLIYEHNRCVHISFDPRLRGEELTQRGGAGTRLEPGILD
jgi:zinc D-Ala-D-Ala carboxypeptidase